MVPVLDPELIDADADRVVRKLAKAGFKAYLVGGCVRDLLVGKKPKDFDVATSATPNEIRNTFRNCRIIGRRFRLAHVVFGDKIIETSTFRANPRDDDEDAGELLIRRDNVFGSENEDAKRRDFTINGLFYDVERQRVIDHVGGLPDLKAGLIRTIGDPDIRFQEDPIRMLRALKFSARLGFEFEQNTFDAMLRWRHEISKCAPPRILEELYRMLRGGAARRSFELLVSTDTLAVMSPQLAGLMQGVGAPVQPSNNTNALPNAMPSSRRPVRRSESEFDNRVDDDESSETDDDVHSAFGFEEAGDLFPGESLQLPDLDGPDQLPLDSEEQSWHRVWADAPPTVSRARRSMPANLRLSFLRDPKELAKRRALTWLMLPQIDNVLAQDQELSPVVALGCMLNGFLQDDGQRNNHDGNAAIAELALPIVTEMHVTRRDSERLRFILMAQRKFAAAARKQTRPQLFGARDLLLEAALLYQLTEAAAGREVSATTIEVAGTAAPQRDGETNDEASTDGDDEDGPRKKRRRRRGGRFR
jgi:tRNA nucleotidyltransferase/poly(A) polymerase